MATETNDNKFQCSYFLIEITGNIFLAIRTKKYNIENVLEDLNLL